MSRNRFILAALCAVSIMGCSKNASKNDTMVRDSVLDAQNTRTTIWDALKFKDTETVAQVNKYIWAAALDVLSFLPIEAIDPFTGVITTGYGTPPGGNTAYRATVLINDPALDARSLKLALNTRSGPVDVETLRAVEDAILTRARQLRQDASKF